MKLTSKGITVSLIEAAWMIYAINFVTGIDVIKLVADGISGKLNLKTTMTSGISAAMKKLQTDPVNTLAMLGITWLIKNYAHKAFGRKKIIDFGGLRVTL